MTRRKLLEQLFWPTLWLVIVLIFGVAVNHFGFMLPVSPAS